MRSTGATAGYSGIVSIKAERPGSAWSESALLSRGEGGEDYERDTCASTRIRRLAECTRPSTYWHPSVGNLCERRRSLGVVRTEVSYDRGSCPRGSQGLNVWNVHWRAGRHREVLPGARRTTRCWCPVPASS